MGIKFAMDIIKEIEKRGAITVPSGYVTGEVYEEWLYDDLDEEQNAVVVEFETDIYPKK